MSTWFPYKVFIRSAKTTISLSVISFVGFYLIVYPYDQESSNIWEPLDGNATVPTLDLPSTSTLLKTTQEVKRPFIPIDPHQDFWQTTVLNKQKIHVYSAFLDQRLASQAIIRINVVAPFKTKSLRIPAPLCLLERRNGSLITTNLVITQLKEHFSLPYCSYFFDCKLNHEPILHDLVRVALTSEGQPLSMEGLAPLKIFTSPEYSVEIKEQMVMCVKPFHYNWDRALWLVEFMEMYKLLGVSHFVFYNHTVGSNVDKVLRKYTESHEATVLRWNLPLKSQKEIRTEAIFTALNDCNLRAVNRFQYAVVLDVDEFIFPRKKEVFTLQRMIQDEIIRSQINRFGSFVTKNAFFYLYWENDTTTLSKFSDDPTTSLDHPYLLTQAKTRRTSTLKKHGYRSKYICLPHKATLLGNHNVWTHISGFSQVNIPDSVALSHHYRICEFGGFDCMKAPSVIDQTAHKWAPDLFPALKNTCQLIFGSQGCPIAPPLGSPY
ncbi:hypothetical protein TCAL_13478 [Tigriopus californicus]|uniref:Glycosyltransferase family 92 protein n=1 Tax=Tigriopus californicus TaxID=6832 RepID=A0A553NTK5_TIGCA|nr:beta-1,4-galactosyltransferase galt-1-like [Tigriopus californicus]TRY68761.1 hypothetical protein TCAL_13478 [Tigriopus californicus]